MSTTPQEIFNQMSDAFQPQIAGSAEMQLQFSLSGNQGGDWKVEIGNGTCQVSQDRLENPLATIHMRDQDFIGVFSGKLNAVAAFMSGKIRIDGDVTAIMNLLSFFNFS